MELLLRARRLAAGALLGLRVLGRLVGRLLAGGAELVGRHAAGGQLAEGGLDLRPHRRVPDEVVVVPVVVAAGLDELAGRRRGRGELETLAGTADDGRGG